jgi:hypothetical protein
VPQIGEDKPVRILHLSFRDFLISNPDTAFHVNEKAKHGEIGTLCFRVMKLHLKKNMCNLESPGTQRATVDPKISAHIFPPEFSYACRYWGIHFASADLTTNEVTRLMTFLKEHLLHWVEAMSLLGLISEVIGVVDRLRNAIPVSS